MFYSEDAKMEPSCQEQKEKLLRVSAVIPTLDAGHLLPLLVGQLAGLGEVILADGGSAQTPQGGRVIAAPRGRGEQMIAGAAAAQGDWLLFLHADTRLDSGWEAVVCTAMQAPGHAAYFRFALDDASSEARRLEAMVTWRCQWLALPYGDQGLLISRALYEAVGGFQPIPLMEDVDLVRRLGRSRLAALPVRAITSAERWRRQGWWVRSARNLCILMLWFLGVSPARLVRLYGK